MKQWRETAEVFARVADSIGKGESCTVALLHQIKGSSYRRPGAKLFIAGDGGLAGNVSGGCLELDLRERAAAVMTSGSTVEAIHYDTGTDEDTIWGLGLGCEGEVDILLRVFRPDDRKQVDDILQQMQKQKPFRIVWNLADGAIEMDAGSGEIEDESVYLDALQPPPALVLLGGGIDAEPLIAAADTAGFDVTVIDHREANLRFQNLPDHVRTHHLRWTDPFTFPGETTCVVVKNHALEADRQWALRAVQADIDYLGLLGPKKRCRTILQELPENVRGRAYGPIGLDVGAEGAEQIAVCIIAEILAVLAGRSGGHLRDRAQPIHA